MTKMIKLPYSYVCQHVDKLYDQPIDHTNINAINRHCEFIQEFITACGWDMDDYIRMMMGYVDDKLTTN